MKCDKCGSNRIMEISGKTSDLCSAESPEGWATNGYVPANIGISKPDGGGDYITFEYCLDCGKIQGEFPISQENYKEEMWDEDGEYN